MRNFHLTPFLSLTAFAFILLIGFLCLIPGFTGPFLLDDTPNILPTKINTLSWEEIQRKYIRGENLSHFSRKLTYLTFSLTQYFHDHSPYYFKYENTLLHLINGLLIYWLCYLLFAANSHIESTKNTFANALPLIITAIWLLHPLHVSTILYAVQRLVLLSSLFTLLTLIFYIKGRILSNTKPFQGFSLSILTFSVFLPLGLLSKENAALTIVFIIIIEFFIFRFSFVNITQKKLYVAFFIFFLATPIFLGLTYFTINPNSLLASYAGRDFSLSERLLTQSHAIWLYISQIAIPLPSNMSLYHDGFLIQKSLDLKTVISLSSIVLLIATAFTILRKKHPLIGFGIIWFFTAHLIESTIIPLELVFEHRNYLAAFGIIVAIIDLLSKLIKKIRFRLLPPILFITTALLLAFNTYARSFTWGSHELLITSEYISNPNSPRVLSEMAVFAINKRQLNFARELIHRSQQLSPDDPGTYLLELTSYCSSNTIPENIVKRSINSLNNGRLTTHATASLAQLLSLQINKQCSKISKHHLLELTSAAINNTHPHMAKLHTIALVLHARTLRFAGQWTESLDYYIEALKASKSESVTDRREIIQDIIPPLFERESPDKITEIMDALTKMEPSIIQDFMANN